MPLTRSWAAARAVPWQRLSTPGWSRAALPACRHAATPGCRPAARRRPRSTAQVLCSRTLRPQLCWPASRWGLQHDSAGATVLQELQGLQGEAAVARARCLQAPLLRRPCRRAWTAPARASCGTFARLPTSAADPRSCASTSRRPWVHRADVQSGGCVGSACSTPALLPPCANTPRCPLQASTTSCTGWRSRYLPVSPAVAWGAHQKCPVRIAI